MINKGKEVFVLPPLFVLWGNQTVYEGTSPLIKVKLINVEGMIFKFNYYFTASNGIKGIRNEQMEDKDIQ